MNKKTQSGFAHLVVITVVLGLVVVGLLSYVFWQNFVQPKANVAKTGSSSELVEKDDKNQALDDTETVLDKITDWKTYTDSTYGFSFKYPSDWATQNPSAKRVNSVATPEPSVVIENAADDLRVIIYPVEAGGWGIEGVYGSVSYTASVNSKQIILSDRKYDDGSDKGVGKDAYEGYTIMSSFDYSGNKYVIISTGSDISKMSTADDMYKKVVSTWQFK